MRICVGDASAYMSVEECDVITTRKVLRGTQCALMLQGSIPLEAEELRYSEDL